MSRQSFDEWEAKPQQQSLSWALWLELALNANDNDTTGTAVQEVMKSHVPGRTLRNPTTWGTLTLQ